MMKYENNAVNISSNNDLLLMPFLRSNGDENSETILTELFTEHADPICAKIVEFRTGMIFDIDYFERQRLREDLKQEVRLKMLTQLRQLQRNPASEPIHDFKSYVARITHNLIHDYFRTKFRPHSSLRKRDFELPESEIASQENYSEAYDRCSSPLFAIDLEAQEERIYLLRHLWQEIMLLPPNQSAAWLLKADDKNQESTLKWLPVFRIASIRQIAAAIGLTAEALAQIWNDLPISDQRIAEMLGVTQRQVINLRKSANERLARRMKKAFAEPAAKSEERDFQENYFYSKEKSTNIGGSSESS